MHLRLIYYFESLDGSYMLGLQCWESYWHSFETAVIGWKAHIRMSFVMTRLKRDCYINHWVQTHKCESSRSLAWIYWNVPKRAKGETHICDSRSSSGKSRFYINHCDRILKSTLSHRLAPLKFQTSKGAGWSDPRGRVRESRRACQIQKTCHRGARCPIGFLLLIYHIFNKLSSRRYIYIYIYIYIGTHTLHSLSGTMRKLHFNRTWLPLELYSSRGNSGTIRPHISRHQNTFKFSWKIPVGDPCGEMWGLRRRHVWLTSSSNHLGTRDRTCKQRGHFVMRFFGWRKRTPDLERRVGRQQARAYLGRNAYCLLRVISWAAITVHEWKYWNPVKFETNSGTSSRDRSNLLLNSLNETHICKSSVTRLLPIRYYSDCSNVPTVIGRIVHSWCYVMRLRRICYFNHWAKRKICVLSVPRLLIEWSYSDWAKHSFVYYVWIVCDAIVT